MLERRVSARELTSGIGSPELVVVGLDPATVGSLGGLTATNGDAIDLASLPEGSVVLSQSAADELGAATGDQFELFANGSSQTFTVAAIAENSYLSGMRRDNDIRRRDRRHGNDAGRPSGADRHGRADQRDRAFQ